MRKNHLFLTAAIAVLLLSTLACQVSLGGIGVRTVRGSGEVITVKRQVSDFDSVDLSGIGHLSIEVGDEESLLVEVEDNLIQYIETEVNNGTLEISIKGNVNIQPTEAVKYYLTVRDLEAISVSGAGNVETPWLEAARFSVHISGAGGVDMDGLDADELDVHISGLGNLTIHGGVVNVQDVEISGSGSHESRKMESAQTDISLSGLGNAAVWVTDRLSVDISGAGTVKYAGDPSVDSNVSGLGSIHKIGE
jgi:hypothetical protein